MGVDFVKSDSGNNRPKGNGYDIEYTHPELDKPDPIQPKRPNLLGKKPSVTPVPDTAATQPVAKSATMPPTEVSHQAAYQPQPQLARHLPPPPPPPVHATATVAPVKPPVRHNTPPAPVLPPSPPAVKRTHTAVVKPAAPLVPPPPPTPPSRVEGNPVVPTAPAASAPMTAPNRANNVGEVIAQNVSSMRGETTHPEALTPEFVGVNLLPNAIQRPLQHQTALYRLLRASTMVVMFGTLVYLGMVGYQAFFVWRTQATLAELDTIDQEIVAYRGLQREINDTSTTLNAIQQLLNDHIYWSQWFAYLERYTLPTVYYSGFSGNANGSMNLQAVAPDFTTISQQIAVLQALPDVHSVTVSTAGRSDTAFSKSTGDSASTGEHTVQFNLSLQVDPAVIHYQPHGVYAQSQ